VVVDRGAIGGQALRRRDGLGEQHRAGFQDEAGVGEVGGLLGDRL